MTHLSVSEERRNGVSQRGKYREELLRSQQGELDAVLMYQRLAKVVKTDKEREAFLQLAKEEGVLKSQLRMEPGFRSSSAFAM